MTAYKTYFNWSTGKDSALALYYLLQDKGFSVDKLVTTVEHKAEPTLGRHIYFLPNHAIKRTKK